MVNVELFMPHGTSDEERVNAMLEKCSALKSFYREVIGDLIFRTKC